MQVKQRLKTRVMTFKRKRSKTRVITFKRQAFVKVTSIYCMNISPSCNTICNTILFHFSKSCDPIQRARIPESLSFTNISPSSITKLKPHRPELKIFFCFMCTDTSPVVNVECIGWSRINIWGQRPLEIKEPRWRLRCRCTGGGWSCCIDRWSRRDCLRRSPHSGGNWSLSRILDSFCRPMWISTKPVIGYRSIE